MEKLGCKSLMIGEWVNVMKKDSYEPVRVCTIYENAIDYLYIDNSLSTETTALGMITIAGVEPIPLTPEILEKNGFKGSAYAILTLDEQSWLEYYYHEHRLRKIWSGIDEWQNHAKVRDITFQCNCYYLHELQHALRLCGIEKEIII